MLVMPSYENTLLDQTHKAIVHKQIDMEEDVAFPGHVRIGIQCC